jgi:NAD+ synthase
MPIHQHEPCGRVDVSILISIKKADTLMFQETLVDLTSVFETFSQNRSSYSTSKKTKLYLTLVNTRARLRMTTLYYLLACRTVSRRNRKQGGKILALAFTKYGDGGVGP